MLYFFPSSLYLLQSNFHYPFSFLFLSQLTSFFLFMSIVFVSFTYQYFRGGPLNFLEKKVTADKRKIVNLYLNQHLKLCLDFNLNLNVVKYQHLFPRCSQFIQMFAMPVSRLSLTFSLLDHLVLLCRLDRITRLAIQWALHLLCTANQGSRSIVHMRSQRGNVSENIRQFREEKRKRERERKKKQMTKQAND